ncbi:MAG: outer membrane protein assembly factor BamB [Limisphaerales bacterium]|jgi:outer membrane protein assembly factor BamB
MKIHFALKAVALAAFLSTSFNLSAAPAKGWLYWRGPGQLGVSEETNLPGKLEVDGPSQLWKINLSGQSSPVVANGKLYVMGYEGEGPDLREKVVCLDANTGKELWSYKWNDFLSDIIYTRYSTSNPTVDAETGNVYVQGTQGIMAGFTGDGKKLWEHSMMDRFGRMTFPNGRTTSPVINGDYVMTHYISAYWGKMGPARDRFWAFNKHTGELQWLTTPGGRPKDSSYSPIILSEWNGQQVVYSGTGDGSVVCFNAKTGNPLWYCKISQGGVNSSVIPMGDRIIAIHGRENLDNSDIGRLVALRIPKSIPAGPGPHEIPVTDLELWRNPDVSSFASSPILVGKILYQVVTTGDLVAVDTDDGKVLWREKLGIEQRNASMLYADGKIYLPMLEDPHSKEKGLSAGTAGAFYVLKPSATGVEILSYLTLEGRCFGSPCIYNGKIYVQTTKKLYCFGSKGDNPGVAAAKPAPTAAIPGKAVALHIVPPEILVTPGGKQPFKVYQVDAAGNTVAEVKDKSAVKWERYIPATAKVKVLLNASVKDSVLVADATKTPSAGMFKATYNGLNGYIRGRILPNLPLEENFERFKPVNVHPATHPEAGQKFDYPPLPWIGARFKFEIREQDGNKVLTKTIDNKLFQRGIVFMGTPDMANYTIEADVMTEGNRRKMSEIGLICQRYYIVLKGNAGKLQINSNLERIKADTRFSMRPKVWYHLKARVDVAADGSGVIRAKAWDKSEKEPDAWTLEVKHQNAHTQGSPGLFGFAPQEVLCHIDNVKVTPNK